jgi:hypothetical protein
MADMRDPKTALHYYLQQSREALVWKLNGLDEREVRFPRTPTGNNFLGMLKHCLNVEAGYFGPTFGRQFPESEELVPIEAFAHDPQADWYTGEEETRDGLIDLYRRVWTFADHTIEELPLESLGLVPWWRLGSQEVTLQRVMVHVICDLARHAGQADIMREQHDGAIGCQPESANLPHDYDWPTYVAKLTALAEQFG